MQSGAFRNQALREPVEQALNSELRRIDRAIARAWLVLAIGGVAGGLVVAATSAPRLGIATCATSVPILILFAIAARRLDRRPLGQRLAATYLALYFALVRERLPGGAAHLVLYDPPMQLTLRAARRRQAPSPEPRQRAVVRQRLPRGSRTRRTTRASQRRHRAKGESAAADLGAIVARLSGAAEAGPAPKDAADTVVEARRQD